MELRSVPTDHHRKTVGKSLPRFASRELASLGMTTLFYEWQPVIASSAGHLWEACCLMATGRHDEAVASARKALEFDPLFAFAHILVSTAFYFGRQCETQWPGHPHLCL